MPSRLCWLVLFVLLNCLPPSFAQRAQSRLSLVQMARSSGYAFAGTVTAISPVQATKPNEVPSVQITFHVDRAIRGVRRGQTLTIREWAGLWKSPQRYRVGQKLLLFLHRPSKLGLTSPVGGEPGRIPLDDRGGIVAGLGPLEDLDPELATPLRNRGRLQSGDLARRLRRALED